MRKMVPYLLIVLIVTACNKTAGTSLVPIDERIDPVAVIVSTTMPGSFVSNGQNVSGTAKVYSNTGKLSLLLENFKTNNGPDLHVYLSKEMMPVNFIDLGKLKSTNGNQVYEITGNPDFSQYKYALIHCQQYNHLFGSAEITK